jgi:hypothetical protein
MDRAGDAKELATHTELLMQAYARLDNPDEARQVATLSLQLLEDVSLRMIDRKAAQAANGNTAAPGATATTLSSKGPGIKTASVAQTNAASRSSLNSVAGQSRASTTLTRKASARSVNSSGLVVEQSAPNVAAYCTVLRAYVSLQLQSATQAIADGADPRPIYVEICERVGRCADLVSDVTGDVSTATASVLSLRVAAALDFLLMLHQRASSTVTPLDAYAPWLADNLLMCQEYASRLVDLHQKLAQSIPNSELSFTAEKPQPVPDSNAPAAAPVAAAAPTPAAAPATAAGTAVGVPAAAEGEPTEPVEPPKLPYKVVSNPITRNLAMAQMQLAYLHVIQAVMAGEHVSTTVNAALNEMRALAVMTAVERFLYETRAKPSTEFVETRLMKAGQLLEACARNLSAPETPGVVVPSTPPAEVLADVELLRAAATMLQYHRDGVFDCMWGDPMPIPPPPPVTVSVTDADDQTVTGTVPTSAVPAVDPKAKPAPVDPKAKGAAAAPAKGAAAVVLETPAPSEPQMTPVGDLALTESATAARNALTEHARAMVVKYSALNTNGAPTSAVPVSSDASLCPVPALKGLHYACIALIEAYGKHRSATAAMWLLQLQSAQASVWLRSVWRDYSLNPTSAVAASVSRLEELCGRGWPVKGALQQIAAEQEFLTSSSVAYKRYVPCTRAYSRRLAATSLQFSTRLFDRLQLSLQYLHICLYLVSDYRYFSTLFRLSFAADPLDIIRNCPTNLVFLCIQYCPVHNTLYACAGLRTPEDGPGGRKGSVMAAKGAPTPAPARGAAAAAAGAAAAVALDNSPVKDAFWVIDKVCLGFCVVYHTLRLVNSALQNISVC